MAPRGVNFFSPCFLSGILLKIPVANRLDIVLKYISWPKSFPSALRGPIHSRSRINALNSRIFHTDRIADVVNMRKRIKCLWIHSENRDENSTPRPTSIQRSHVPTRAVQYVRNPIWRTAVWEITSASLHYTRLAAESS